MKPISIIFMSSVRFFSHVHHSLTQCFSLADRESVCALFFSMYFTFPTSIYIYGRASFVIGQNSTQHTPMAAATFKLCVLYTLN